MKDIYIITILKYVNKLVPNQRKPKYSSDYYLRNILNLLNDFNSWRSLTKSIDIDKSKRYHYKTISDIHRLWCSKGVYRKAFEEIRKKNTSPEIKAEFDVLIDSTLIINKYGSDYVGYGSETRKKKFSKVTIITNNDQIINVSENKTMPKEIVFGGIKIKRKRGRPKKVDNENETKKDNPINIEEENKKLPKKITINTLEHDINGIIPVLENSGISKKVKINLIGDKGYIIKEESVKILLKRNVKMITPYRKNQKKQNTAEEKIKLKKRSAVERKFSSVKRYNRVHVRKDRYMVNYMGFFYLGVISVF